MNVKSNKHADKIAKLLFSIESVPSLEASKMKQRVAKYARDEIHDRDEIIHRLNTNLDDMSKEIDIMLNALDEIREINIPSWTESSVPYQMAKIANKALKEISDE